VVSRGNITNFVMYNRLLSDDEVDRTARKCMKNYPKDTVLKPQLTNLRTHGNALMVNVPLTFPCDSVEYDSTTLTFPREQQTNDWVEYLWSVPSPPDEMTYSMWITPYTLVNGVRQCPVSYRYGKRTFRILLEKSTIRIQHDEGSYWDTAFNFTNGQQIHICFVAKLAQRIMYYPKRGQFDFELYADGKLINEKRFEAEAKHTRIFSDAGEDAVLIFGQGSDTNGRFFKHESFSGTITDFMMYTRALSVRAFYSDSPVLVHDLSGKKSKSDWYPKDFVVKSQLENVRTHGQAQVSTSVTYPNIDDDQNKTCSRSNHICYESSEICVIDFRSINNYRCEWNSKFKEDPNYSDACNGGSISHWTSEQPRTISSPYYPYQNHKYRNTSCEYRITSADRWLKIQIRVIDSDLYGGGSLIVYDGPNDDTSRYAIAYNLLTGTMLVSTSNSIIIRYTNVTSPDAGFKLAYYQVDKGVTSAEVIVTKPPPNNNLLIVLLIIAVSLILLITAAVMAYKYIGNKEPSAAIDDGQPQEMEPLSGDEKTTNSPTAV